MADVRKLLARLNPANIRYDVGRGGLPELTPVDIAGALAFVPAGLGREVFCACWWPDGAALAPGALDDAVARLVRAEMDVRHRRWQCARLELHIAQENALARRVRGEWDKQELTKLEARADDAKASCWPWMPEMHVRIRRAVLDELSQPNHCPACAGKGHVQAAELIAECSECLGRGIVPVSDRTRATRIGKAESTYRRVWRDMYEWLYDRVSEAEVQAARAFSRALAKECECGMDRAAL